VDASAKEHKLPGLLSHTTPSDFSLMGLCEECLPAVNQWSSAAESPHKEYSNPQQISKHVVRQQILSGYLLCHIESTKVGSSHENFGIFPL
jgi:hypothetical protein